MTSYLEKNVLLSNHTNIGLGGKANYFLKCATTEDIYYGLNFAKGNALNIQVIAGGSNIIFPDEGFNGVILLISLKGVEFSEKDESVYAKVSAGESWDEFVASIIERGLTGVECLSGIPGSVGATPIQNVGAYGQEVKETISEVKAIDKVTLEIVSFNNLKCNFSYRNSRFKSADKDRYIITEITFRFNKNKAPEIKYEELKKHIELNSHLEKQPDLKNKLIQIRSAVLELRKKKAMVIDKNDPDSRSCGSFFLNPVLNETDYKKFIVNINENSDSIPVFKYGNDYKISAAWLVEKSGFHKGYEKNGAGISNKHSLALVNINGTTKSLLVLAEEIEKKVFEKFGIQLKKEPVIIGY